MENLNNVPLAQPSSQWAKAAALNRLCLTHWLKAILNRPSYSSHEAHFY